MAWQVHGGATSPAWEAEKVSQSQGWELRRSLFCAHGSCSLPSVDADLGLKGHSLRGLLATTFLCFNFPQCKTWKIIGPNSQACGEELTSSSVYGDPSHAWPGTPTQRWFHPDSAPDMGLNLPARWCWLSPQAGHGDIFLFDS